MELVINVPDDFYERMIEENGMSYIDAEVVVDAFYKATPLPKRHGRLIDIDAVLDSLHIDKRGAFTKHDVWLLLSSFGTRTILEANKGRGD